jgi:hypothetical protein
VSNIFGDLLSHHPKDTNGPCDKYRGHKGSLDYAFNIHFFVLSILRPVAARDLREDAVKPGRSHFAQIAVYLCKFHTEHKILPIDEQPGLIGHWPVV